MKTRSVCFSNRWGHAAGITSRPSYTRCPSDKGLDGPHNWSRRCWEAERGYIITILPGIEPRLPDRSTRSLLTTSTELPRIQDLEQDSVAWGGGGADLKAEVRGKTLKSQLAITEKQQIQTVSWTRRHISAFSKTKIRWQWRNYFPQTRARWGVGVGGGHIWTFVLCSCVQ